MKNALLSAVCVVCALMPAAALSVPGVPLIDQVARGGTHWVAWRIRVPQAMVVAYEVQIAGDEDNRQAALAEWLIGDNGHTFTVVGLTNTDNGGTHVQTIATGAVIDEPGELKAIDHGVGVVHRLTPATYTVVLAWDGADTGTGRLYGEAGLEVLGRTDGVEASWSPQREFDGVANADMNGSGATVAGSVTRQIEHRLFGVYAKFPGSGVEAMSYTGPSAGIALDQALYVDSREPTVSIASLPFFIFNGDGAGRYDFSVLGGVHYQGGVTLITADVRLP